MNKFKLGDKVVVNKLGFDSSDGKIRPNVVGEVVVMFKDGDISVECKQAIYTAPETWFDLYVEEEKQANKFNIGDRVITNKLAEDISHGFIKQGAIGYVEFVRKSRIVMVDFEGDKIPLTEECLDLSPKKRIKDEDTLLNGKFICIKIPKEDIHRFTVGKVYEFKDGYCITDNGDRFPKFYALHSSNRHVKEHFIPHVEKESNKKEELLNGDFVCINGLNEGVTTAGKVYKFVDGCSKYDNGSKMPNNGGLPFKNLEDLNNRMASKFEPYEEELLNGKFVCIETVANNCLTAGKVYTFINGVSKYDDGDRIPKMVSPFKNLEELNETLLSKFIPFVE